MKLKNNLRSIVFDFDGVILDSNKIKSDAFRETFFDEDPALVESFVDYHKKNGGVSRFEKIKYFYQTLQPTKDPNKKIQDKINLFGEIVERKLKNASFIPGIVKFLGLCQDLKIDCFVCSGGKEDELIRLSVELKISEYFKCIFGSPKTKLEILKIIQDMGDIGPNTVYFGDALSDYKASQVYGLNFVYVSGVSEWEKGVEFCQENNIRNIKDFRNVKFE